MDTIKIVGGHGNRREMDFYPTPPECTVALVRFLKAQWLMTEHDTVWEPASGQGDMVKVMRSEGLTVTASDLQMGFDFLDRDFELDGDDWYGITVDGASPFPKNGITNITHAKKWGIKTWVSFEPVLNARVVLGVIEKHHYLFDKVKIGKLNYYKSDIDWKQFGREAEALCQRLGIDYYIKDSLRKEMES